MVLSHFDHNVNTCTQIFFHAQTCIIIIVLAQANVMRLFMESVITMEIELFLDERECFYNALLWCKLSCNNVRNGHPKGKGNFV